MCRVSRTSIKDLRNYRIKYFVFVLRKHKLLYIIFKFYEIKGKMYDARKSKEIFFFCCVVVP